MRGINERDIDLGLGYETNAVKPKNNQLESLALRQLLRLSVARRIASLWG